MLFNFEGISGLIDLLPSFTNFVLWGSKFLFIIFGSTAWYRWSWSAIVSESIEE